MLARVLSDHAPTVATAGSFNNELGLPLTVLRVTEETRYLVLEMGARGIGHLRELCEIAPPDISLVLNVGRAHIGEFGSQEAIAQAKGEIVEALDGDGGTAVLNADDALVRAMAERTSARAAFFGRAPGADVRLGDVTLDDLGRPSFDLAAGGHTEHVTLQLLGEHQATNAAATAATALAAGLGLAEVAESLRGIDHLSKWRMELHERADGLVVVNDAYNANPDSMRAALETLARMGQRSGRRTVAVLGAMLELGADLGGGAPRGRGAGPRARDRRGRRGGRRRRRHPRSPRRRPRRGRHDAPGRHRRTRRGVVARECGRAPTSCWSRRRGAGGSNASPTCSSGERSRQLRAILLAGGLSLLFTLVGTRYAIIVLAKRGYGQLIRDDGPTTHHTKRGTPTMGGLVIVLASVLAYFIATFVTGNTPSASALLLIFLFVGLGTVGFLDDYIKISRQRSLGLRSRAKFIGQTFVALVFGWLALSPWLEDYRYQTPAGHAISFIRDPKNFTLPVIVLVLFIWLLIAGASNAVNLTDGLDGLAAGASVMTFGAYTIVNIWQNNQWCGRTIGQPKCYEVRDPLDLAVVAAAITGACFGFLWWNASPAKIFMGDTGSLALGGALAGFAVLTRTEFLLALLGGLFVIQTLSVILQVGYFKATKGKRLFRMAPLHHHFEMLGWEEITVVIRFWLIAGIFVAAGLGVFYAEWVAGV